jgi:hypothetical protein
MPFDKLKAPSTAEGLRVDTEPFDFLRTMSESNGGAFYPDLKIGV